MTKEFIPYEQALALKKLGFDEPCFTIFLREEFRGHIGLLPKGFPINSETNNIDIVSAPLYQQAFRWFREKYNMVGEINSYYSDKKWSFNYDIVTIYKEKASDRFNTYEEAELECLKKLIQIVKEK
jgi:hypothetical protein